MAGVIGISTPTAAASGVDPLAVPLGTHTFGTLRTPDAIVAMAGPDDVGFYVPPSPGEGVADGPGTFEVVRDGSIWLFDVVNDRLLVWPAGRPGRPARAVPLPERRSIADFAVAPNGTIYVTDRGAPRPARTSP